jgi:hypothetical protein
MAAAAECTSIKEDISRRKVFKKNILTDVNLTKTIYSQDRETILRDRSILISLVVTKAEAVAICEMCYPSYLLNQSWS